MQLQDQRAHITVAAAWVTIPFGNTRHCTLAVVDASLPVDARLLVRLKEAREHLRWNPAAGRPARFLDAHSAQGQVPAARATALAAAHGVPELRELVVKPYVLLYAHGNDRVVLLALKHQRELAFRPA